MAERIEEKLKLDKEELDRDMELWKVAIDTQMHFNDLLIKMRTTVTSIILAVFGGAAIALKNIPWEAQIFIWKVKLGALVLALGLVFLLAQFIIDFFYYFKLLQGSVNFTENIDKKYEKYGLFGLTQSIIKSIPYAHARAILFLYYGVPAALGLIGIYIIQRGLTPVIK